MASVTSTLTIQSQINRHIISAFEFLVHQDTLYVNIMVGNGYAKWTYKKKTKKRVSMTKKCHNLISQL